MRGAVVEIAVWFGVLVGMTVVLISSVSPVELLVAGVAASGGALAARRLRLAAGIDPGGARGALRSAARLPGAVLGGCAVLARAVLARALLSGPRQAGLRRVRLRPGVGPGWAATLVAASPDTCVLEIGEHGEVLVHALGPRPGPVERVVADSTRADAS
ncbi:hypothetical protein [Kitasatospora sp. NPDC085464]|uniref:hypothetical protein n=1 Tax=Kitasatospora sp. NPDC085464 TaxID=3364063 RepID=UPI0037C5686D